MSSKCLRPNVQRFCPFLAGISGQWRANHHSISTYSDEATLSHDKTGLITYLPRISHFNTTSNIFYLVELRMTRNRKHQSYLSGLQILQSLIQLFGWVDFGQFVYREFSLLVQLNKPRDHLLPKA